MDDPGGMIRETRRRLVISRAFGRFQREALLGAAVVLAAGAGWRLAGGNVTAGVLFATVGAAWLLSAIGALIRSRVSLRHAAAEADRILGTRERISTVYALNAGRARDPLGFGPSLQSEAEAATRGVSADRIRRELPLRVRPRSLLTATLVGAFFLVPLIPLGGVQAIVNPESTLEKKEKEKVAEALRRLERKIGNTEILARKRKMAELEKLAREIRKEAGRLEGDRPNRARAMARMGELERRSRNAARRFAGLPRASEAEGRSPVDRELRELAEALQSFLQSDPESVAQKFSTLAEKLAREGMEGMTRKEIDELGRAIEEMRRALEELEGRLGKDGEARKALGQMWSPEQLARMAAAMKALQKSIESGDLTPEQLRQMAEQLRNYRDLQPTPEQMEAMLKALEELARMIEAGEQISLCRGGMGGLIPAALPGFGFRRGRGFEPGPTSGPPGPGTGSSGRGMGGDPGTVKDERATRAELDPGRIGEEGTAVLMRSVRRMPSPDRSPAEYRALIREANREAEEAIRRGEIPRRYREYVKRFFDSPETK